jgi:hypothetical protein
VQERVELNLHPYTRCSVNLPGTLTHSPEDMEEEEEEEEVEDLGDHGDDEQAEHEETKESYKRKMMQK